MTNSEGNNISANLSKTKIQTKIQKGTTSQIIKANPIILIPVQDLSSKTTLSTLKPKENPYT